MLDPLGRVITWSRGSEDLFGYSTKEILGRPVSVLYTAEENQWGKPESEREEAATRGHFEEEGWRIRKDGRRFWALATLSPVTSSEGRFVGFSLVVRELTERRVAENSLRDANTKLEAQTEELLKSQIFLDSMIEELPHMVFVKEAQDLRFVRFNKAGEELLGHPRSSLLGKNDYDLFPKEQADHFTSKDRVVLSGNKVVDIPEEFIQTPRGRRILHTRKIPIFGPNGEPEYLLGVSEDITEWKTAEAERLAAIREAAALEERERATQRTAFLAEASTVLASSLDYQANIRKLVSLAVPILADWCTVSIIENGVERRVAVGHHDPEKQRILERMHEEYPIEADPNGMINEVLRTGHARIVREVHDEDLQRAARDVRHLEFMRELGCVSSMLIPIEARGKIHGAIALVSSNPSRLYDDHDVALGMELGRRAAVAIDNASLYEAAQKAIRARDEFLSIASHELKTPITSLKLQIQVARRNTRPAEGISPPPVKLAKMLDLCSTQVTRLTALIDDLLDISRIESGRLAFRFDKIDFASVVRESVERYQDHMISAGSSVKLMIAGPHWIEGDRFRLEQVVLNLLSNAAKYAPKSPVEIRVEEKDDQTIRLACRDFGPGIPSDKLDRIFERFERVVTTGYTSGLGLGLYITREIVVAHQGRIYAESEIGSGATFYVELPKALTTSASST